MNAGQEIRGDPAIRADSEIPLPQPPQLSFGLAGCVPGGARTACASLAVEAGVGLGSLAKSALSTGEKPSTFKDVSTYNNFYKFGTPKDQPAQLAKNFKPSPWAVSVEGEAAKPRKFSMEEILKLAPLEERIY